MKTAKFYYLSALTGALILGGPALADSKSDEAAFVAAERANMLAVDRWATNTRSELTRVGSTDADRLRSIQGDVQEFLNNIQKVCRDNPQAQKLEAYIHSKFHGFYDISDITHGVNMSCSPDHKLRPTLWITKITLKNLPAEPKAANTKSDPTKSDTTKSDPAKSDPAKSDPSKSDPAKAAAAKKEMEANKELVVKRAKIWANDEYGDLAWIGGGRNDDSTTHAIAHFQSSTKTAADELGKIACANGDGMPEFTKNAFVNELKSYKAAEAGSIAGTAAAVLSVTCNGGRLHIATNSLPQVTDKSDLAKAEAAKKEMEANKELVMKRAKIWANDEYGDLAWIGGKRNDDSTKRAIAHFQNSTMTAADELGKIACAAGDGMTEFIKTAFVGELKSYKTADAGSIADTAAKVLSVTCSSGKLRITVSSLP